MQENETCPGKPICNGNGFCPDGSKVCVCKHGFKGNGCENPMDNLDKNTEMGGKVSKKQVSDENEVEVEVVDEPKCNL